MKQKKTQTKTATNLKVNNFEKKLTLAFLLSNSTNNLDKALESINNQIDKNFNLLILVDDYVNNDSVEFVKNFKFDPKINIAYAYVSLNLGKGFCFDNLMKFIETDFFYTFTQNVYLLDNFVQLANEKLFEINYKTDVLSFFIKNDSPIVKTNKLMPIKKIEDELMLKSLFFYSDKIFNKNFLINKNISHDQFNNYPLCFLINLCKNNPKWYLLKSELIGIDKNVSFTYSYNVLDTINQCTEIVKVMKKDKSSWEAKHFDIIEYMVIVCCYKKFLIEIIMNNLNKKVFKKGINSLIDFVNDNFHHWKKNKYFSTKYNKNKNKNLDYLINFKPYYFYIKLSFKKIFDFYDNETGKK